MQQPDAQQNETGHPDATASPSTHGQESRKEHHLKITPRWASTIGALVFGLLYLFLPEDVTVGPNWLPLLLEGILLFPLVFSWLSRRHLSHRVVRLLTLGVLAIVTAALGSGILLMSVRIASLQHAVSLLVITGVFWLANILVFALWYWEIDGGGPARRQQAGYQAADFMFPEQANSKGGTWVPRYFDYLFLAFNTATAFSPTATTPITPQSKVLMMTESMISLLIIALLAARAVNII